MSSHEFDASAPRRTLVTGANTGIGYITARELARRGDLVTISCRSKEKALATVASISAETGCCDALEWVVFDLGDLESVRAGAAELLRRGDPIDVLVANAGIGGQRGITPQGFEMHFGTNHLGHFLFVTELLPLVEASAPSRVVVVASDGHLEAPGIDFDAVRATTSTFTGFPEYAVSKLANVLFAQELARRVPTDVWTGSLHPGVVATDVWRRIPWPLRPIYLKARRMISPEQGARTTLHCADSDAVLAHSGRYWADCARAEPSAVATPELAAELWERSDAWVAPYR